MTKKLDVKMWARWTATFIGFPLAGLAAKGVAGNIDSTTAALVGGLAAGATLGAVQSVALRVPAVARARWAAATAIGMAAGLTAGGSMVDFQTDTASLVVMGALTGLGIGIAQAAVLVGPAVLRAVWLVLTPALWALGWLITSQVISNVDDQFANFGASGALVAAAVGGLALAVGLRPAAAATPATAPSMAVR